MNYRAAFVVTTAALALTLASASGARPPFPGKLITPHGIGKLRLGMSAREAQRLLRPVATPYPIREINVRPGVKYLEYEYRRDPFGVDYLAGFLGRPGKRRLVAIGAFRPRERTREGIRVGMPASRIFETYRARVSCMRYISCRLGSSRVRHILFVLGSGSGHFNSPNEFTPRVTLILAREGGLGIQIPAQ